MTQEFYNNLAKMIAYHRKLAGMNREQLARLAGVGKTVIFDIEHGKQTVRLDTLMKVLLVLNIKMEFNSPLMQSYREQLE